MHLTKVAKKPHPSQFYLMCQEHGQVCFDMLTRTTSPPYIIVLTRTLHALYASHYLLIEMQFLIILVIHWFFWSLSSWNISMQLKSSGSGHVLTIGSLEGHRITLSIETTRTARLSIYRPGSPDAAVATELQIEQDRFSETVQRKHATLPTSQLV